MGRSQHSLDWNSRHPRYLDLIKLEESEAIASRSEQLLYFLCFHASLSPSGGSPLDYCKHPALLITTSLSLTFISESVISENNIVKPPARIFGRHTYTSTICMMASTTNLKSKRKVATLHASCSLYSQGSPGLKADHPNQSEQQIDYDAPIAYIGAPLWLFLFVGGIFCIVTTVCFSLSFAFHIRQPCAIKLRTDGRTRSFLR